MDSDNFVTSGADNEDVEDVLDVLEDFDEVEEGVDVEAVQEEKNTIFSNPIESLLKFHPECVLDYEEEEQPSIPLRTTLSEDDSHHKSMPFLSTFERTKILGMRTNQLAQGARPYVQVPAHITNVLDIAKLELEQRRLPIIVKRHMPDGRYEKFRLSDFIIL
jgi:DNA-directed RNA polymerase I, II, and III subunit RPABC2